MSKSPTFRRGAASAGFTLIEIMIVAAAIALLSTLAMPGFMKARNTVQDNRFMADLRVITDAFEQYALVEGTYPLDAAAGVVPTGMAEYLSKTHFDQATSLGGQWNWDDGRAAGTPQGVSVVGPGAAASRFRSIDQAIDDGDPVTGLFRRRSDNNGYLYMTGQ